MWNDVTLVAKLPATQSLIRRRHHPQNVKLGKVKQSIQRERWYQISYRKLNQKSIASVLVGELANHSHDLLQTVESKIPQILRRRWEKTRHPKVTLDSSESLMMYLLAQYSQKQSCWQRAQQVGVADQGIPTTMEKIAQWDDLSDGCY